MSSTTFLGVVPDRRPVDLLEVRNGHGWSPSIWRRLLEHRNWGTWPSAMYDDTDKSLDRLWRAVEELEEWEQAPLVLTFDTGVVPCTAFEWCADQLEEFERRCPERPGYVNHVPAAAELLRSGIEVPLFGVHGTSVSENPFNPWDFETDTPGRGIPLADMYVLERHRHEVTTLFRGHVARDPRRWETETASDKVEAVTEP